ncbi:MAG: UDP-3-O-acyl-N-acetylglucosamine deacetylase [Phycisphaerales bacterium]
MTHTMQRTLAGDTTITGVGLFTGAPSRVVLRPADADAGIVFVRTDTPQPVRIPASLDHLAPAEHRTALHAHGVRLETVEHCLAALAGLAIDNATIEVHGPELPIGDGSCLLFTEAIEPVGIAELDAPARMLVVREPIEVTCEQTGAVLRAEPSTNDPEYRFELDYGPDAPIHSHHAEIALCPETFCADLAFARTFSTLREAEAARAMGLFTHLEPKDMLVIGPDGPIDNALRRDDEPARHKVIDMIGDLSLVGRRLHGRFIGQRSGHALNHALARALTDQG